VFSDGGFEMAEPIPPFGTGTPPWDLPTVIQPPSCIFLPRRSAVALHNLIFALYCNTTRTVFIYTDGSASANPGRCGSAAAFFFDQQWYVFNTPVGLGFSLTAELCAFKLAFAKLALLMSSPGSQVRQVFMFSDSQTSIGLLEGWLQPRCHYRLVSVIRDQLFTLRAALTLSIFWSPGHTGINGNVRADQAAAVAATQVQCTSPSPGQPLVPQSLSRSLTVTALRLSWQHFWSSYCRSSTDSDSLGRIRQVVGRWHVISLGSRPQQTLLARLRFGHCPLRAHLSRFHPNVSPFCACGERETVAHFLLHCRLFVPQRTVMFAAVRLVYSMSISEAVLLGEPDFTLSSHAHLAIVSAVHSFVLSTGRFRL
jgi:ribonuclease HI